MSSSFCLPSYILSTNIHCVYFHTFYLPPFIFFYIVTYILSTYVLCTYLIHLIFSRYLRRFNFCLLRCYLIFCFYSPDADVWTNWCGRAAYRELCSTENTKYGIIYRIKAILYICKVQCCNVESRITEWKFSERQKILNVKTLSGPISDFIKCRYVKILNAHVADVIKCQHNKMSPRQNAKEIN
jgi:hypothetical protein